MQLPVVRWNKSCDNRLGHNTSIKNKTNSKHKPAINTDAMIVLLVSGSGERSPVVYLFRSVNTDRKSTQLKK